MKLYEKSKDLMWIVFGILVISFWYSGFADWDHFSEKGILILVVPFCGVIASVTLFVVFTRVLGYDLPAYIEIPTVIVIPYLIPIILLVCSLF